MRSSTPRPGGAPGGTSPASSDGASRRHWTGRGVEGGRPGPVRRLGRTSRAADDQADHPPRRSELRGRGPTLPVAGMTARRVVEMQVVAAGRVAVTGAAGGVGRFVVQLAAQKEARMSPLWWSVKRPPSGSVPAGRFSFERGQAARRRVQDRRAHRTDGGRPLEVLAGRRPGRAGPGHRLVDNQRGQRHEHGQCVRAPAIGGYEPAQPGVAPLPWPVAFSPHAPASASGSRCARSGSRHSSRSTGSRPALCTGRGKVISPGWHSRRGLGWLARPTTPQHSHLPTLTSPMPVDGPSRSNHG